jgi:hypothetical protein
MTPSIGHHWPAAAPRTLNIVDATLAITHDDARNRPRPTTSTPRRGRPPQRPAFAKPGGWAAFFILATRLARATRRRRRASGQAGSGAPLSRPRAAGKVEGPQRGSARAYPSGPQPQSGAAVSSTQIRPADSGSAAAAATRSVKRRTTASRPVVVRHVVDVGRGLRPQPGDARYLLDRHHRSGQVRRQSGWLGKGLGCCVNVDHRHGPRSFGHRRTNRSGAIVGTGAGCVSSPEHVRQTGEITSSGLPNCAASTILGIARRRPIVEGLASTAPGNAAPSVTADIGPGGQREAVRPRASASRVRVRERPVAF